MCFCFAVSFLLGGILHEFLTETIWKAVQEPACLSAHSREIPNVHQEDHHVPVNTRNIFYPPCSMAMSD